jgi:hypothetical protein
MGHGDRRKCKCCLRLFRPDPRNRRHQRFCATPSCKAASKADSQARWRAKPENQGDFSGPLSVARVQAWRARRRRLGVVAGMAACKSMVKFWPCQVPLLSQKKVKAIVVPAWAARVGRST